eukprot:TRINITY_DN5043_c0_g1_i1.p1 TRINITY_DN5043_c0_g1~~TRINITY_DN5043_c0_g1_i1.p1  ORF type:complete len:127 (-),score=44.02 TRINITY_DN5043_c0_g1_i1:88-426(-)
MRTSNISELIPDVQQGGLYVFFGGASFPVGNATQQCSSSSAVVPCPAEVASFHVLPSQSQTLFSFFVQPLNFYSNLASDNAAVVQELAVSSLHYSGPDVDPRLAGRVEVIRV